MLIASIRNKIKKHYRHGRRFEQHYNYFQRLSQTPIPELQSSQEKELKKLIEFCYKNIPYYREQFDARNINYREINTLNDLKQLPIIDKHTIKKHWQAFNKKNFLSLLNKEAYTSGTTGTPVKFLRDYNAINFENAAIWHYWHQAGDHNYRRMTLRGEMLKPVSQSNPPFWTYNGENNELVMSSYHLSAKNIDHYMHQMQAFQPDVLYCYPSTGALLAKLLQEKGFHYSFQSIFTSSEMLNPAELELMETTFGCQVFDWYGQAERVASIFKCASGHYHINESYSIVELVPAANHTPHNQRLYEIIGTHLNNYAMPLLRYRTHDLIELAENEGPCSCGSPFRMVKKVIGRKPSYIVTPEGDLIGNAPANILKGIKEITEAQFYQDNKHSLQIKIIPSKNYSAHTKKLLTTRVKDYVSPQLEVDILEVDFIERGPNGKFVALISSLSEE
ncbi:phenylacetate--CoA ligase family protein [Vampirovibrio sp.]|uniref:phenylacetate--CoA ligase family protein n=1 Tax=Vampirovibrio sp. TaxID=2717857 RepID=UPI003593FC83